MIAITTILPALAVARNAGQRIGQIARRRRGRDDSGLEAIIERSLCRRFHAHVRHEAGEDELLAAGGFERCAKRGAGKRIGKALFGHGFGVGGRRFVDDGETARIGPKRAAGPPAMLNVNDERSGPAGPRQQCGDFVERSTDAAQRKLAVEIFMLGVDDEQNGVGEVGRRCAGARHFKESFRTHGVPLLKSSV
ncbi:MAG: hypothetical protein P8Z80_06340 [Pseudolabrys sp.]